VGNTTDSTTSALSRLTPSALRPLLTRDTYGPEALMLAAALMVRVVIVALTHRSYVPVTDDADYSYIASSLTHGHGFGSTLIPYMHGPTAFRPPLYPVVLSLTYLVTGTSWTAGRLENAVIGMLAVAAIGSLACAWWDRRVARVAMAIAAVFPPLLLASYGLGYEALMVTLVCVSLACTGRARRSEQPLRWLVLAGIASGLGILTRETAAVTLLPLAVVAWQTASVSATAPGPRRRAGRVVAAVGIACLVVAPWTIRNAVRFHAFVPVSTSLGFLIEGTYNSTSPGFHGGPAIWIPPSSDPKTLGVLKSHAGETEAQANSRLTSLAEHYVETHPSYPLRVAFWNTVRLFDLRGPSDAIAIVPFVPYNNDLMYVSVYSGYVVGILALVGCFTKRARRVPWYFWTTGVLLFLGIILVAADIRQRSVLEPFIVVLAALAVVAGLDRRHRTA
jgi:4-amino-4-deoxy-L-arabinose transferase-like glycosyltransferase